MRQKIVPDKKDEGFQVQEKIQKKKISPGGKADFNIDLAEYLKTGNPLDFLVNIAFERGMVPLKDVNLNQKNKDSIHRVYRNPNQTQNLEGKQNMCRDSREFYVISSTTFQNKRIYTIRSQYCFVNKTGKTL